MSKLYGVDEQRQKTTDVNQVHHNQSQIETLLTSIYKEETDSDFKKLRVGYKKERNIERQKLQLDTNFKLHALKLGKEPEKLKEEQALIMEKAQERSKKMKKGCWVVLMLFIIWKKLMWILFYHS